MVYVYGDPSRYGDVGAVATLEAVGPVVAGTPRNTLLLVGTSERGPTTLTGLDQPIMAAAYYHDGKLKRGIEDAFGEGCPRIYAKRVLGAGFVTASVVLTDGLDGQGQTEHNVCTVYAKSAGAWGNSISIKHYLNPITHVIQDYFVGNNTTGPYALSQRGLSHKTTDTNRVLVDGLQREIKYTDSLGIGAGVGPNEIGKDLGQVYVNEEEGYLEFYDEITTHMMIEVFIDSPCIDVEISDNESTEWRTDIHTLDDYVGALNTTAIVTAVAELGETHLPECGTLTVPTVYGLENGDDGATVALADWSLALNQAGAELKTNKTTPTSVASTDYEVQLNSYDLISVFAGWAMNMNTKWMPTICYMPTRPNETVTEMIELSKRYANRHLAIVYPSWDMSETAKNLAVCSAAREAAVPLGHSVAKDDNRLKTPYGLLGDLNDTIDSDYVVTLNRRGIYVLEKTDAGVGAHMGVTTDKVDQFKRTVDQRTANQIIVDTYATMSKYFFEQNTREVRDWMNQSLMGFLSEYVTKARIYDFITSVLPDSIDPNMVHILMKFIPMGHIEWMDISMKMGVYRDLVELQAANTGR